MAPRAASLVEPMASLLMQPVPSSMKNAISGKGQEGEFLACLALPLMMKVRGKGVTSVGKEVRRAGREYNKMEKKISSTPSFKRYRDFNYESRFNGVFSRNYLSRIKDEHI